MKIQNIIDSWSKESWEEVCSEYNMNRILVLYTKDILAKIQKDLEDDLTFHDIDEKSACDLNYEIGVKSTIVYLQTLL